MGLPCEPLVDVEGHCWLQANDSLWEIDSYMADIKLPEAVTGLQTVEAALVESAEALRKLQDLYNDIPAGVQNEGSSPGDEESGLEVEGGGGQTPLVQRLPAELPSMIQKFQENLSTLRNAERSRRVRIRSFIKKHLASALESSATHVRIRGKTAFIGGKLSGIELTQLLSCAFDAGEALVVAGVVYDGILDPFLHSQFQGKPNQVRQSPVAVQRAGT